MHFSKKESILKHASICCCPLTCWFRLSTNGFFVNSKQLDAAAAAPDDCCTMCLDKTSDGVDVVVGELCVAAAVEVPGDAAGVAQACARCNILNAAACCPG